jgi:orotidine-5'-phosphate decarboxylase
VNAVRAANHETRTKEVMIQAGSHFLVIGRTITHAENPLQKLLEINKQICS